MLLLINLKANLKRNKIKNKRGECFLSPFSVKSMKFNNGKFKILILSDLHERHENLKWTLHHMERAVEISKPDLVVLLGDNIAGEYKGVNKEKVKTAVLNITDFFNKQKLFFAPVFGNHDHEGLCSCENFTEDEAKSFIMKLFCRSPYCLGEIGNVSGVGNYNIVLKDSQNKTDIFSLFFLDSGTYADGGYGYVKKDTLNWYEKTVLSQKEEKGKILPSFVFQHIIVPEIYNCLTPFSKKVKGSVKGHGSWGNLYFKSNEHFIKSGCVCEGPCPPEKGSGQFDLTEALGSTLAIFSGHDHVNDFDAQYKKVRLIATPSAGYFSYGNKQGFRTVTLFENDLENFETKVFHADEVCTLRPKNVFIKNFGYQQYERDFKPYLTAAAVTVGIASAVGLINRYIKFKK